MNYRINNSLNLFGTLIFTVIALINQEVSVFYMMYLFWWQEIIEIFGSVFSKFMNGVSFSSATKLLFQSLLMMGVYLIFIVIIFGFVFSFKHQKLFTIFAEVLFFKNTSFNLNLLLAVLLMVLKVKDKQIDEENHGPFSTNMLILHISIILGTILHFVSMRFWGDTLEGSFYPYLISAIPFLVLKTVVQFYGNNKKD